MTNKKKGKNLEIKSKIMLFSYKNIAYLMHNNCRSFIEFWWKKMCIYTTAATK